MTSMLFLEPGDAAARRAIEAALTDHLVAGLRSAAAGSPGVTLDMARFADELRGFDFACPRALDDVIRWAIGALSEGCVPTTHPRYLGLFNPAPTIAAECADRIAAAFNPQLAVWSHAPVASSIEQHVIESVVRRIGYPPSATGHFTSG